MFIANTELNNEQRKQDLFLFELLAFRLTCCLFVSNDDYDHKHVERI